MRNVVSGLFLSLDGVAEAPNEWQFDHFDAGMMAAMTSMLDAQDAVLLGRVTYQEWAGYWPTSTDEPFASFINGIPKYVVSTTLDTVEWSGSTLLKGDLAEEIARLKQQPGKNIGVAGSPTLVRSLLENDLLDELTHSLRPREALHVGREAALGGPGGQRVGVERDQRGDVRLAVADDHRL